MVRRSYGIASFVFAAGVLFGVASANAQANVMKECGAEWQAAKTANKVKPGETWKSFLADCRKAKAEEDATPPEPTKPATAAPAAPTSPTAAAPAATPAKPAAPTAAAKPAAAGEKPLTPNQIAARERIKKCGAEWTAAKEAGKIPAGQKWPQYWHECSVRLKAAGQ